MIDYNKKFISYLRLVNKKLTIERQELLQAVLDFANQSEESGIKHFNAKDIFHEIKKIGSPLSLATVYRVLPIFCEAGIIVEVAKRGGKMIYELASEENHHDHLICIKCGRIIEFRNDELELLQQQICKKLCFCMTDHQHCIKGICIDCKSS